MFKLFIALMAFAALFVLIYWSTGTDRTIEAARYDEQDRILVRLQALNDPTVTEFINDWRQAFPQPSMERLSELRLIEQNIKNDRRVAAKYTLESHQQNDFSCKVTGLGGNQPCEPGLQR